MVTLKYLKLPYWVVVLACLVSHVVAIPYWNVKIKNNSGVDAKIYLNPYEGHLDGGYATKGKGMRCFYPSWSDKNGLVASDKIEGHVIKPGETFILRTEEKMSSSEGDLCATNYAYNNFAIALAGSKLGNSLTYSIWLENQDDSSARRMEIRDDSKPKDAGDRIISRVLTSHDSKNVDQNFTIDVVHDLCEKEKAPVNYISCFSK